LKGKDPDEHHNLHNIRGNGLWLFEPDLQNTDCRDLFHASENIETSSENRQSSGVHPAQSRQSAFVVFKVSSANVITSMSLQAEVVRRQPKDVVRIWISRTAGIRWTHVWESRQIGSHPVRLHLRDEVAGLTECLVKVEMFAQNKNNDVGFDRLKLTTITQLNRRTLPKLTLGSNQVRLSADRQTETTVLWTLLHADQYKTTVFSEKDVYSDEKPDGMYKATVGAGKNGTPCEVTWRINVPTDISRMTYGAVVTNKSPNDYVSLQYSYDGLQFREFYRKIDGDAPFDKQVLHACTVEQIPAHTRQAFFKSVFYCKSGAAAYTMSGIQDVLIQIEHQPRKAQFQPIEIIYNWTEHRKSGEVTRSHTELVSSVPHTYTINVTGFRDPTMNWVRLNLKNLDPQSRPIQYGYSDGIDVGTKDESKPLIYQLGDNIAQGKSYTTSRPASTESKNPDTDGMELTNGKIIAPTDITTSKIVQAATAFWESGEPVTFIVDLERTQKITGVRVSTHQPNEKYCHPSKVEIAISRDKKNWHSVGRINHNDIWQPPGDYEAWEHDDDPQFNPLPAAGRLAYSYPLVLDNPATARFMRFICTPLSNRGLGLSELEIFNKVIVRPAPPLVAPFPF